MGENVGLITGKFYPPHLGHSYLIDSAWPQVDRLVVIVHSRTGESIPGDLRAYWLRRLHPNVEVIHDAAEFRDPLDLNDMEAWDFWTRRIRDACPVQPDIVFSSEDYGDELARRLGARHIVIDRGRTHFPVSGSQIRSNPLAHLDFLSPMVRAYYVPSPSSDESK